MLLRYLLPLIACATAAVPLPAAEPLRALIVDGENKYHAWRVTTPILKSQLEASGRFVVDVSTAPPRGEAMDRYRPVFADYDVVVSNYAGRRWPAETESAFVEFLAGGGGFVSVHAANNAFPDWPEYNEAIGLGGWGGRKESAGPYVYYQQGKLVRDGEEPGAGGGHGPQHEFVVTAREPGHPILRGLPGEWRHTKDELYHRLRGPAKNLTVLATAFSAADKKGTGRDEPMLMTLSFGRGRVFHTTLGHAADAMRCVGFATTFCRGAEWAATGKVTLPMPDDFPTRAKSSPIESPTE